MSAGFFSGCGGKDRGPGAQFEQAGGKNAKMQRRELFSRSIDLLNRLEDHSGDEVLAQVSGHLDQWIEDRAEDPYWQKDEAILQLREVVQDVSQRLDSLAKEIRAVAEVEDGARLQKEARNLATPLREAAEKTRVIGTNLGLVYLLQFQEQLGLLADKLDSPQTSGLVGDSLRNFVKQVPAESLQKIADLLRGYSDYMDIRRLQFSIADADYLKQAVWLRDVALWASGDQQDDLERTKALFDWVVRNIDMRPSQISDPQSGQSVNAPIQAPWETLLMGSGSRWDRAWLFVSLLRQLRIEASVLGIINEENPGMQLPWLVGVLHEGEIYLFSPGLGMPIPKLGGLSLEEGGGLRFEVATLREAAEEPEVLRQLDLGGGSVYPYSAEQIQEVAALLDLSPPVVSQRMKILEGELSVNHKMVLYIHFEDLRDHFEQDEHVARIRHWWRPYQYKFEDLLQPDRLLRQLMIFDLLHPKTNEPVLWKGRLHHFEGNLTGPSSATTYYQDARLPDRLLRAMEVPEPIRDVFSQAKLTAGYWLGLVAAAEENDEVALDFFQDRTLRTQMGGQWLNGALYNIGRIHEANGDHRQAIQSYLLNSEAPDAYGNRLRAKWIAQKAGIELKGEQFQQEGEEAAEGEAEEPSAEGTPDSEGSPQSNRAPQSDSEKEATPEGSPGDDASSEGGETT